MKGERKIGKQQIYRLKKKKTREENMIVGFPLCSIKSPFKQNLSLHSDVKDF